jgi:hypothetical protein
MEQGQNFAATEIAHRPEGRVEVETAAEEDEYRNGEQQSEDDHQGFGQGRANSEQAADHYRHKDLHHFLLERALIERITAV